jgi:hypothetical protein
MYYEGRSDRGLDPRSCSLGARERESLAPSDPETGRSDLHPQLSPRSREPRTLATARERGVSTALAVNDTAPVSLDGGR